MTSNPTPPPSDPSMAALIASLQATLTALQSTVTTLDNSVTQLKRIVEGEPGLNVPSLRQELHDHCRRLDEIEDRWEKMEVKINTTSSLIRWIGGGSLAALGGVVAMLKNWFGGGQ